MCVKWLMTRQKGCDQLFGKICASRTPGVPVRAVLIVRIAFIAQVYHQMVFHCTESGTESCHWTEKLTPSWLWHYSAKILWRMKMNLFLSWEDVAGGQIGVSSQHSVYWKHVDTFKDWFSSISYLKKLIRQGYKKIKAKTHCLRKKWFWSVQNYGRQAFDLSLFFSNLNQIQRMSTSVSNLPFNIS